MQITDVLRIRCGIIDARWTNKECDEPPVARIKIKVQLIWHIQIGLFEDERHAKHTLIEINDLLAIRANEGNVMDSLSLDLGHRFLLVHVIARSVCRDEAISIY